MIVGSTTCMSSPRPARVWSIRLALQNALKEDDCRQHHVQVVTKKKKCGHQRTIDLQVLCQNDLGVQIVKELFMCGAKLQKLGVVLALVRPYSPPSSKQSMWCRNKKKLLLYVQTLSSMSHFGSGLHQSSGSRLWTRRWGPSAPRFRCCFFAWTMAAWSLDHTVKPLAGGSQE